MGRVLSWESVSTLCVEGPISIFLHTIAVQSRVPLTWLQVLLLSGSKRKARSQSWEHSSHPEKNVLASHDGGESLRCLAAVE
jgi:hypothetical protein